MGMKARANVATFFKYFVLIFMGFIMVYPLLWMVGSTFKTNAEIFTSLSPFTAHPTLDGYYNAVTKTYGGDITIWRARIMVACSLSFASLNFSMSTGLAFR